MQMFCSTYIQMPTPTNTIHWESQNHRMLEMSETLELISFNPRFREKAPVMVHLVCQFD